MPKPIAIVCADTHLQDRAWAGRHSLRGDAYFAFSQIVDIACEMNLPIIAAGDIIDKRTNESGPIRFLRTQLDKLEDHNIPFMYVQGDHDLSDPPWVSAVHGWPTRLHRTSVNLSGVNVHGIDYQRQGQLEGELARIPGTADVLIAHQKWEEYLGGIAVCEGALISVPHVRMVMTGDFHKHEVKETVAMGGRDLTIVSPGATCMQAIDESEDHAVYVLHDDLTLKSEWLSSRQVVRCSTATTEREFEKLLDGLLKKLNKAQKDAKDFPEEIQTPIVVVRYYSDIADAYGRLARLVADRCHLFASEVIPASTDEDPTTSSHPEDAFDLKSALPAIIPDGSSKLFQTCAVLLDAEPRQRLRELRDAWFKE